jgi:hypothetical protein
VFIASVALFLAVILLFAGFLISVSSLVMAQQTTTTGPLLSPPPASSGTTTGQSTSPSLTSPPSSSSLPLTPQEQEQLNRLQNVIAATNLNLDETEKQIGGIVYTPRWSDPVWVEPDSAAVLVAYCLPGEFAESGQEILGGSSNSNSGVGVGFELEVLESYEVALPQNFTAWMMVIGNEDRQNRYPAAVGVICASDANNVETRVVSPQEQQQINNVVQQITTTTSIDQVINIINRNNNNNATNQNATGGGAGGTTAPPTTSPDTTPPTLTAAPINQLREIIEPDDAFVRVFYGVDAEDNIDGTASLSIENMLTQDMVGGSITISCNPPSNTNFPVGIHTVQCSATDAAGNRGTTSFIVQVTSYGTGTVGTGSISISTLDIEFLPSDLTGVDVRAEISANTYNGPCPVTASISGTITDNVGNRDVTYRLIRSDGGVPGEAAIHFNQPRSEIVFFDSDIVTSFQGWAAIEITQPVQLQSNRVEFQVTCTAPSTGGAAQAPQTLQAENDTTTAGTTTNDEEEEEEDDTTTDGAAAGGDTTGGGTGDTDNADQSPPAGTTSTDGEGAGDTTGGGTGGGGATDEAEPQ